MIRQICMLGFALLTTACDTSQPAAEAPAPPPTADTLNMPATPANEPSVLTSEGWGPLRVGMTRAEIVAAAGEDANPNAVGGPDPAQCDQFRPGKVPEGLLVMVEQGRLTRISVSDPATVETDRGFQVGDSAAVIKKAYGNEATVTLHKYQDAPAEYIVVWTRKPPAPEARGIVYEIGSDGRVMHIHVGGPSIQYVEGCL